MSNVLSEEKRQQVIALDGTRKELMEVFASMPLLIIDDLGMRKFARHRR